MNDKTLRMLGLCKKAGALLVGTNSVIDGIVYRKTKLVIITKDAAENTVKRLVDKCNFYNAKYEFSEYTRSILGSAVGGENASAVAITDENLLDGYLKSHSGNNNIIGGTNDTDAGNLE